MKIYFQGPADLTRGLSELAPELGFSLADKNEADLTLEGSSSSRQVVEVRLDGKEAVITYGPDKTRFFRGLGLLLEQVRQKKTSCQIEEEALFTSNGAMLDVSRNAVMRPGMLKFLLRKMAVMGLNTLMLYTEDTYEVPQRPYFGYMRGRYTKEELRDLDRYALDLGIELVPCVQFLGHLATALRWNCTAPYRDTPNILLVDAEETYAFLDDVLKAIAESFSSRRLHMGMDEAHALGLGQFLARNGYEEQTEIFFRHLARVSQMAKEHGFSPMMWSDMFFRMNPVAKSDYDVNVEFDASIRSRMPDGLQQIFWDYYHDDKDFYTTNIDKHKFLGENTIFAGGIWAWVGGSVVYDLTLANTLPALEACKEKGIKEIFATIWHNGAESNLILALAGLQIFAEYDYGGGYDEARTARRFAACCQADYQDFMALSQVDGPRHQLVSDNVSRYLLYNDPLIGLFDKHVEELDPAGFYADLARDFAGRGPQDGVFKPAFDVVRSLLAVLEKKADFGVRLRQAYTGADRPGLEELADECLVIMARLEDLRLGHREAWLFYNKPFGWEILEARYAALHARFSTARDRIRAYLAGSIPAIEELEEERLPFDCGMKKMPAGKFGGGWGGFTSIYTAGVF